ncbi:ferrochelatase [Rubrivivax gelatinosus]|uniref:Ferrochelatase n=1 Tax=Rubrivivax gelatinosus TaxID=28068 RepID=A0ABS1DS99_RUBGE|nr:ferrochelatase [Rubrivivax gelatinosus]MBK1712586.1 ferrochelatase [Rubrivivax gelatinosus]
MTLRPEPPHRHGEDERVGLLLVNLGTPTEPTPAALRRYLAEFLSDPRVVEIPRILWLPILYGIVLSARPAKSAAKYATIWTPEGSPLAVWSDRQAVGLSQALQARGHRVQVRVAMRYGEPSVARGLDALRAEGATRVLVLPLYPQYAGATTGSVADAVMKWTAGARRIPEFRFVNEYHDDAGYVGALAERVRTHWREHGQGEKLLLSFHGVPHRTLLLGDPYCCQCHKTARLLRERLELTPEQVVVTFQSRFGNAKWLEPYTEPTLRQLAADGVRRVDVMCPGFVSDCLETLEEINEEARHTFLACGGERFEYIPCLNDQGAWIEALASIAERHMAGWETRALPDAQETAQRRQRAAALGATI